MRIRNAKNLLSFIKCLIFLIMNKNLLFYTLVFFSYSLDAQIVGGNNVYEFLNLSPSARVTALGGNLITVRDDDVSLAYANPALLNPLMDNQIAFNQSFDLADISHGYVAYGKYIKKWDATVHGGIQYISFGTFDQTDVIGNVIGTFKANEYAITFGAGKTLYEHLSVGANVKLITSQFESYNSLGIAGDFAVLFHDTVHMLNVTILFKNVGTQITTFTPGNNEPLPFEIQVGVSKKLPHLPFRFSIIYNNLQRWNVLFNDPNLQQNTFFFGEAPPVNNNDFLDNLVRHFVFNGEFLFGKKENFRVRAGYSQIRRKELEVRNIRSLTGFSFGFGMKVKRFRFDFGHSFTHTAGGPSHFSVSTNLKEFKRR